MPPSDTLPSIEVETVADMFWKGQLTIRSVAPQAGGQGSMQSSSMYTILASDREVIFDVVWTDPHRAAAPEVGSQGVRGTSGTFSSIHINPTIL